MKPHSWGWLCNSHSFNSLLINYSSIVAKTNFTLASSAGWGIEVGVFQFLRPQVLKKHLLLVSSNVSGRDVSGRVEMLVPPHSVSQLDLWVNLRPTLAPELGLTDKQCMSSLTQMH